VSKIIEIQIFVSCPGDVKDERDAVKEIVVRLNNMLEQAGCSIRYFDKDWRNIIGQFGPNMQETITDSIGLYDVYLGIWWMRFGTKTGNKNPVTGESFESGTHEEFTIAYERWKTNQQPRMYVFFKSPKIIDDKESIDQYAKIIEFRESHSENDWVHKFDTTEKFKDRIVDLFYLSALKLCTKSKVEQKQAFVKSNNHYDSQFKYTAQAPAGTYISRKTSHFAKFKDSASNPFLQIEKQTLVELITKINKIVILGDAGSGKSTELKSLQFNLSQIESPLIPIFQQLNNYTPDQGIENLLPQNWSEIPEELILIILDGLDEIQPEHFNTAVRQITSFFEKYPEIKVIISCRTNFYELPVNNSPGTLVGFEPYFLNDLDISEVGSYYTKKYAKVDAQNFIKQVFENNLEDIVKKPFFLMLLTDSYKDSGFKELLVNKAELYSRFILSRIELDENHFKGTFEIREKKQEILCLLEKVALSMETLAKNYINEDDLLTVISSQDFKALKYCTAFKKKEGEETIWQFEHNNIQEYLAARVLSKMTYKNVIQFLTFEPDHKKLIPSWVNTLAFLFSILKSDSSLLEQLLNWMLENEKEVVVKFERDKISETKRNQLFQAIFNHYKKYDVWIRSNKFNDRELSKFGQSEDNIRFLINEIKGATSRTNQINAIALLGYFKYSSIDIRNEITILLTASIDKNISDPDFIRTIIHSLKDGGLVNESVIEELMQKLYDKKNQYIRSAIYSLLIDTDNVDKYIDYLIEGNKLIDSNDQERTTVNVVDESWTLKNCFKKVKTSEGVKKLIKYISGSFRFKYDSNEILQSVVENAINLYMLDNTLFDSMFSWFMKETKSYNNDRQKLVIRFFEETETREKAFYQIWNLTEDKDRNRSYALAKLATPTLFEFIIEQYNNRDITNKELESLFYDVRWAANENFKTFEFLINSKTTLKIEVPEYIDHDKIRKEKLQSDFNLLFDPDTFQKDVMRVFEEEETSQFTYDELFEIRKRNNKTIELEDHYSGAAIRLLREFASKDEGVEKQSLSDWFNKPDLVEWYQITHIHDGVAYDSKEIVVTDEQRDWIADWCMKNINTVEFKKAITVNGEDRVNISTKAIYLWFFYRKFELSYPKEVLLDMLSFDHYEDTSWEGIEYLTTKLSAQEIKERLLLNIQENIADSNVLKNHINYLVKNHVKESYPFILNEIVNKDRKYYLRDEYLKLYFEHTQDINGLKTILPKADSHIKWEIIEKLRISGDTGFLVTLLLNILEHDDSQDEKLSAAENLVIMQNTEGVKYFIDWVKKTSEKSTQRIQCLKIFKNVEALPYLIDLLDVSYNKEIQVEPFESLNSIVINAFYNIALLSEDNFKMVKDALERFLEQRRGKYKNVNYLLHTIQRLENQFYMNKAQSYTIAQVKEKIDQIA
jgi:hypothetical protein